MHQKYNKNKSVRQQSLLEKFNKVQARIQKRLDNGSFIKLANRKQQQLLKQLKRYAAQLQAKGYQLRHAVVGSALALALTVGNTATAQITFTTQTGSQNPFNGVNVGAESKPTFVDIDNDGDFDAFIGEYYGNIIYYKNTGNNTTPIFTPQTGSQNPFNGVNEAYYSSPTFVDIDNDGDFDAFIGEEAGGINYYKNTGNNTTPTFTKKTGSQNPFNGVFVGSFSVPTFVDIDNDGDFDAFIGEYDGNINYYKNTGNNTSPTFTKKTGNQNPFNGVDVGSYSAPTFVDIDNDGDFDAFIGEKNGNIFYHKNTSAILPVELTAFTVHSQENQTHLLQWQTASEENNKGFEVQRSQDGINWEALGFVEGNGTTLEVQNYAFTDNQPLNSRNYYRLKQIDFDGVYEYSSIIAIDIDKTIENEKAGDFYPNPSSGGFVNLDFTASKKSDIRVSIFDITGKLMFNQIRQVAEGNNRLNFNFSTLNKGIYIVKIGDTTNPIVRKLII